MENQAERNQEKDQSGKDQIERDYKIKKYLQKFKGTTNEEKIKLYSRKISFYQMAGGSLMKPRKKSNAKYDGLIAAGYGQLKKHTKLEPLVIERREPGKLDVLVQIENCGICHSDWHSIKGEWSASIPLVPGHEISGRVVQVGSSVKNFKAGDRVGIGPYVNSCRICSMCKSGQEQRCLNGSSPTYDGFERKPNEIGLDVEPSGGPTYGGFSNLITVNKDFVFGIPPNIPLDLAAPLLCAGITTYSPLKAAGTGPKSRVGVAGIGGLGHMAVKLARAMGAHVVALTHTKWKLADSLKIGANESFLMSGSVFPNDLDLIIDTIPKVHDLNPYIQMLGMNGTLVIVGVFEKLDFDMNLLAAKNRSIKGSIIGGIPEINQMLKFCSEHKIYPEIEKIAPSDINQTYQRMIRSDVRYRFVIDMAGKL